MESGLKGVFREATGLGRGKGVGVAIPDMSRGDIPGLRGGVGLEGERGVSRVWVSIVTGISETGSGVSFPSGAL